MTSSSVELVIRGLSWTEGRPLWLAPAATPGRRGALGPVQPSWVTRKKATLHERPEANPA